MQDPNRPIGSFLFLGPTGVGKTELTKALAAFLFDDERAMVRIDMSEFMEKHAVSRLIGAPPGYVGYDEGGVLTEAVRRRPYQVILFDEVEKAHEDVFNVLLQVLDDGRLTDGQGRTVDFKNTIIVLTSNLGSDILAAQPEGEPTAMVQGQVMRVVRAHFRPEFLNRLDEIILFRRLQRADMAAIVEIQLERLRALLADRKIGLELDRAALDWLATEGYDSTYGARPLKRVIQRSLQNPLAGMILEGAVKEGETVHVSAGADGLTINGRWPRRRKRNERRLRRKARRGAAVRHRPDQRLLAHTAGLVHPSPRQRAWGKFAVPGWHSTLAMPGATPACPHDRWSAAAIALPTEILHAGSHPTSHRLCPGEDASERRRFGRRAYSRAALRRDARRRLGPHRGGVGSPRCADRRPAA